MTACVFAPRVENPNSDVESIVTGGGFRVRPSAAYVVGGQWVQPAWTQWIPFTGVAITIQLDPLVSTPYELEMEIPDNKNGRIKVHEFRTVVGAGPVGWETFTLVTGPTGGAVPTDTWQAQLDALYAIVGGITGGATNISGITGVSTDAKALIATPNSYSTMLGLLGGAPLASPALTGNPTAPTPTAGDNDTSIATTAFVTALIGGGSVTTNSPTFTGTTDLVNLDVSGTAVFAANSISQAAINGLAASLTASSAGKLAAPGAGLLIPVEYATSDPNAARPTIPTGCKLVWVCPVGVVPVNLTAGDGLLVVNTQ